MVIAVGALAGLCGCSGFERIDFVYDTSLPVDVLLSYEQIRIPEGVAIITQARPTAGDGLMARSTEIQLTPKDPGVLGVALALPEDFNDSSESAQWSFVLFGVKPGTTAVTVRIDGATEGEIPAFIDPQ